MKLFVDIWYNVVLSFSEKSAALLIVIDTQKCSNHMLQNKTYVTLKKTQYVLFTVWYANMFAHDHW